MLPTAILAPLGVVAALLLATLPTCLYLYIEPRSRFHWARPGDSPGARRAPVGVRAGAWLSFAVGQLAVPALLVPVACAGLVYVQAKLGIARLPGVAATVALGALAVLLGVMALGLLPLGVRLLMGDARACGRVKARARTNAWVSGGVLASSVVLGWAMAFVPGLVHPWLRAALVWTALRPVQIYAAVCLTHAGLLGWCARSLARGRAPAEAPAHGEGR
jgi:hypothetical protein